MATKTKIKIIDDDRLRSEIDELHEQTDQLTLSKWAIQCAKHVLTYLDSEDIVCSSIIQGLYINELWQEGKASVHEVRKAGFKLHDLARQCISDISKNAIRTAGHAVGVGHMREHAMVCSDYAIKTIQIAFPNQLDKITQERQWQLSTLKRFLLSDTDK